MTEEFDLSKKIFAVDKSRWETYEGLIRVSDVKEFIRRLKETKIISTFSKEDITQREAEITKALFRDWQVAFFENLKKLAGEKLK